VEIRRSPGTFLLEREEIDFSAELFNCSVAVSNFRPNAQRSADDLNFRPQFSIFSSCFESSAELSRLPPGDAESNNRQTIQINVTLNWFEELKQRAPVK
jgi:hypothetical protein